MRHHDQPSFEMMTRFPWFRIKTGEQSYQLRIPEIATASELTNWYLGIQHAAQRAVKDVSDVAVRDGQPLSPEAMHEARRTAARANVEMFGALGFVIMTCWRDSRFELVSQSAYRASFPIRVAIRDGQPLDDFDAELVEIVRAAEINAREQTTDLKTGFGLMCWDELLTAGFSHEAIQTIGLECVRYVFESIKSKSGSGVEIIADF